MNRVTVAAPLSTTETRMARSIPTQQYETVLDTVARHPDGIAIDAIESELPQAPNRRTLQRWLHDLADQGHVRKEGRARGTRYLREYATYRGSYFTIRSERACYGNDGNLLVPLSDEAREIEARIGQPWQERTPVGYNRAFLYDYRPNVDYYLPAPVRAELLAYGQGIGPREPTGSHARRIAQRLLIDLSWNSSRLEGNTYSLLETERLLCGGATAPGRSARDALMILNHKGAIEYLIDCAAEIDLNRHTVLDLHAMLSADLLETEAAGGRLRRHAVGIGQSVYHPLVTPQHIEECFEQALDTAAAIGDPFEQAFFAMVHLPYLQPFVDVNKRTSRLAANIPLIRRNLCPISFVDVPKPAYISAVLAVYELNRVELLRDVFIWAYKRSCGRYSDVQKELGEPDLFRARYRQIIRAAVAEVVLSRMGKADAIAFIAHTARERFRAEDQARFIEVTETQLLSLHEGNIARYRLRPSQYHAWEQAWK
jgi:hypothetical protein